MDVIHIQLSFIDMWNTNIKDVQVSKCYHVPVEQVLSCTYGWLLECMEPHMIYTYPYKIDLRHSNFQIVIRQF